MAKIKISELDAAAALDGTEEIPIVQDGETVKTTAQDIADLGGGGSSYLKYVALLSQYGTDAPVATVLENTLGGTVVWTRNDVGEYTGTLAGAFTVNKTTVNVSIASDYFAYVLLSASTVDALSLYSTQADGSGIDDAFDKAFIEIRVYP